MLLAGLTPGCRGVGVLANHAYSATTAFFLPNPIAQIPYMAGFALGYAAALPFTLVAWPLSALLYPQEDGGEFYLSAATAPSILLGAGVGALVALPFVPPGMPFVPPGPAEPAPARGPERTDAEEGGRE
ncbi:MAG: hypothetical protein D6731_11280 [Planctomycetota bacterium]|nr:MAG: hypothetical protein D6731_11280 [Planctomycetota bacterium]